MCRETVSWVSPTLEEGMFLRVVDGRHGMICFRAVVFGCCKGFVRVEVVRRSPPLLLKDEFIRFNLRTKFDAANPPGL